MIPVVFPSDVSITDQRAINKKVIIVLIFPDLDSAIKFVDFLDEQSGEYKFIIGEENGKYVFGIDLLQYKRIITIKTETPFGFYRFEEFIASGAKLFITAGKYDIIGHLVVDTNTKKLMLP